MKCAGELDQSTKEYTVSTRESTLTRRRVQNGCWNGYHVQSALVVIYNCVPKILIAYMEKDKQRVWNHRLRAPQGEISCELTHMVFCTWHIYVIGC